MIEAYVESVMNCVEKKCQEQGVSEASFWDWLGNHKFKGDEGNLTAERAQEIGRNVLALLGEYKNLDKEDN